MPTGKPAHPPVTKEQTTRKSAHGIEWTDSYSWLQKKKDPEVRRYLEQENAYTDAYLSQFGNLPDRLYKELLGRIEEDNVSAPFVDGDFIYQSRIEKGSDYRKYYRRRKDNKDEWCLYFDAQAEADGKEYFDLAFLDISPCGNILAYAIDLDGSELYVLQFRNLVTGKNLLDEIPEISGEGEWDASSEYYFFVKEEESRRPFQIYRHKLGDPAKQASLVYEDPDPQFYVGISKSQDMKYLFVGSSSKETTEVSYLDTRTPLSQFSVLFPRRKDIQYGIEHYKDSWLVRTNEEAPDYKLLQCRVNDPDLTRAEIIIPARPGVRLEEVIPFTDHLVFFERSQGNDQIRIRNMDTDQDHLMRMEDPVYDIHCGVNAEFNTNLFSFTYSSPVRPRQTIQFNMDTHDQEVIHSIEVPSGHNPEDYMVYRIQATSSDGVLVPVTILHQKSFPKDGTRPLYLYGYGAYGSPVSTSFRTSWISFLERGWAVAIAHVRGGGLLGEEWYQSGKLSQKKNSFDDFICAAETLIQQEYTQPDRLFAEGGSAGGLLIGAALNIRPDLFRAVVADVPFVDVLNTMMDASLPLTTFEYEEWGNPNQQEAFEYIRSYSPCENIHQAPYPAILATAGFNDPRVSYWEPAKWVATIRKETTSEHPVLLKTYFESGHAGASGRYGFLKEIAFTQAFLISQVQESPNEED